MSRTLIQSVEAYSGWHRLLGCLSHRQQARWVARAWLRRMPGFDPAAPGATPLVIQFRFGAFQVLDARGRVAPCAHPLVGLAGPVGGGR